MKKGLKLFTIMFALMFVVVIKVNAAEVAVTDEATLKTCVGTTNLCKLSSNVVLTDALEIGEEVTIDLNGYTITPSAAFPTDSLIIVLHGGTLTVDDSKGTGKISTTNADPNVFVGIKMTKAGGDDSLQASLIVKAGTIEGYDYGISGNGNPGRGNSYVSIEGGTVKGLSATGAGIFNPQVGTVSISGGKVEGATGIEMRSGTLLVTGGTITGTAVPSSSNANGNGTTTLGAGIAIAQHTTKNDINVAVLGGTIEGYSAVYESNPQGNPVSDTNKVNVAIIDGTINAIKGGTEAVHSETDEVVIVAGGTYNTEIEEGLITEDSKLEKVNGSYVVKTAWDITVGDTENGTLTAPKTAFPGETVKLDINAKEGYKVESIKVVDDFTGEEIEVKENSFVMPNMSVSIEATFVKDEVVPNTGDNILTFVVIGLISLIVAIVATIKLRKNA